MAPLQPASQSQLADCPCALVFFISSENAVIKETSLMKECKCQECQWSNRADYHEDIFMYQEAEASRNRQGRVELCPSEGED